MEQIGPTLLLSLLFLALTVSVPGAVAAPPVQRMDVSLPAVEGPILQSDESYAFNGAAYTRTRQDLAAHGYVEEEYLVRGTGRIYDLPAPGRLEVLGEGPYVTRILVRKPANPRDFNGAVVVEPFNPSHMADVGLVWIFSQQQLMRDGYVWVGVTFKPVAGEALKRFDPRRYKAISFTNPLPAADRCPDLELGKEAKDSEVGFAFDILSQVGGVLRSASPDTPLQGMDVSRVYLTGYSQTAGLARSYAVDISPYATREGGLRIYDGYLYVGHGPFNVLFNNCGGYFPPGDPRLMPGPVGVPIFDIAVEGDLRIMHFQRQPDSDEPPNLYRRYEIAGATHAGALIDPYTPRAKDFERAGAFETDLSICDPAEPPLSDFPLNHVMDAMWRNLDAWVVDGIPPPRAQPMAIKSTGEREHIPGGGVIDTVTVEKDKLGNGLGGVRSVAVDVPVKRWFGSRTGAPSCSTNGYAEPFSPTRQKALYPTNGDYARKVTAVAERLRRDRWLTPVDAEEIIASANRASIP